MFDKLNPLIIAIIIFCVTAIAMFANNPLMSLTAFCCAKLYLTLIQGKWRFSVVYTSIFFVSTIINPLISHNGATVLFILNDQPITFEALMYGASMGLSIIAVICWFVVLYDIFTADKIHYIMGAFSSKCALIFSMAIRYVPLFIKKSKEIDEAQKVLGIYKNDNIIDTITAKIRIFSTMLTWTLENGIVTADSMEARGYGIGKRTNFSSFRFKKDDALIAALIFILSGIAIFAMKSDDIYIVFYPEIKIGNISKSAILGYISYFLLAAMPLIIEIKGRIKWKFLMSKI